MVTDLLNPRNKGFRSEASKFGLSNQTSTLQLQPFRLRGAGGSRLLFSSDITLSSTFSTSFAYPVDDPSLLRSQASVRVRIVCTALTQGALPPPFLFAAQVGEGIGVDALAAASSGTSAVFSDVAVSPSATVRLDSQTSHQLVVAVRVIAFPSSFSFAAKLLVEFIPSSDQSFAVPVAFPRLRGGGGTVVDLRKALLLRSYLFARVYELYPLERQWKIRDFAMNVQKAQTPAYVGATTTLAKVHYGLMKHYYTDAPLEATIAPYTMESVKLFLSAIVSKPDLPLVDAVKQRQTDLHPIVVDAFAGSETAIAPAGTRLSPHVIATATSVQHEKAFLEHSLFPSLVLSTKIANYRDADPDEVVDKCVYRHISQAQSLLPSVFAARPFISFAHKVGDKDFVTPPMVATHPVEAIKKVPVHPAIKCEPHFPADYVFHLIYSVSAPTDKISSGAMSFWACANASEGAVDLFEEAGIVQEEPELSHPEQTEPAFTVEFPEEPTLPEGIRPLDEIKEALLLGGQYSDEEADWHGMRRFPKPEQFVAPFSAKLQTAMKASGIEIPPVIAARPSDFPTVADLPKPALQTKRTYAEIASQDQPHRAAERPSEQTPEQVDASFLDSLVARIRSTPAAPEDLSDAMDQAVSSLSSSSSAPPAFTEDQPPQPEPVDEPPAFPSSDDEAAAGFDVPPAEHSRLLTVVDGRFCSKNSFAPLLTELEAQRVFPTTSAIIERSVMYHKRLNQVYASLATAIPKVTTKKKPVKKQSKRDDDFHVTNFKVSDSRAEHLAERKAHIQHLLKNKDLASLANVADVAEQDGDVTILAYISQQVRKTLNTAIPVSRFLFGGKTRDLTSLIRFFETSKTAGDPFEVIVAIPTPTLLSVPAGYTRFASETLLLSGDIETNPGPHFQGVDRISPVDESDVTPFSGAESRRVDDFAIPISLESSWVYDHAERSEDAAYFSSATHVRQCTIAGATSTATTERAVLRPFAGFSFRTAHINDLQLGWAQLYQGRSFRSANLLNQNLRRFEFSDQLASLMRGWSSGALSVYGSFLNPRVSMNVVSDHILNAVCRGGDAITADSTYDIGHTNHKVWEMLLISLGGCSRHEQFCFNGAEHAGTVEENTIVSSFPFGPDTGFYPQTQNLPANGNTGQGYYLDAATSNRELDTLAAFPIMNNGAIQLPALTAAAALASDNVAKVFDDQAFGAIHVWFWATVLSLSFLPLPREAPVGPANCLRRPLNAAPDELTRDSATWSSAASLQDDGYIRVLIISSRPVQIPGYGLVNPNAAFNLWALVRAGYVAFSTKEILTYWSAWRAKKGIDPAEFDAAVYSALPHVFFAIPPPDRGGMYTVDDGAGGTTNVTPRALRDETLELSPIFDAYSVPGASRFDTQFPKPTNCLHQEPNAGQFITQGSAAVYNQEGHVLQRPTARAFGTQLLTHPLVSRSKLQLKPSTVLHPVYLGRALITMAARVEISFTKVRSLLALTTPRRTSLFFSNPEVAYGAWLAAGGGANSLTLHSLLTYVRYSFIHAPESTAVGAIPTFDIVISSVPSSFAAAVGAALPEAFATGVLSATDRFACLPPSADKFRPQITAAGIRVIDLPANLVQDTEVMFGPNTRSKFRGHLTGRLCAMHQVEIASNHVGNYTNALLSDAASYNGYQTQNPTHGGSPLTYSRSHTPVALPNAVIRYPIFVSSGASISVSMAGLPTRANTALSFAPEIDDPVFDAMLTPDDPDVKEFSLTLHYIAPAIAADRFARRGTREAPSIEAAFVDSLIALGSAKLATMPLVEPAAASPAAVVAATAPDSTITTLAERDQIALLSKSPVRSVAFAFLNWEAVPDLRIAYGPEWPAFFSEYFVASYDQSAYFQEYMASLVGEFVSPVYSPLKAIQDRIDFGLASARDSLSTASLFSYAVGKSQDEMEVPQVYSSLSRLSYKRVRYDAGIAYPSKTQLFDNLTFGIHQPFAIMLLLAYQLSRGARFLIDSLERLPQSEVRNSTTEGLKAYFSAWKILALKVGAARLGYSGNDSDIMDLSILIGYTPRPDEFNDDPVATVRDFFTPKPFSDRYMNFYSVFISMFVPQILADSMPHGDKLYTKDAHVDLWSLWSTSGSLFDMRVPDLSAQLKKNALPFVYSAAELSRLFTQTAMFAKLVNKPDEKSKFRRILAVNLASLFNYIFFKTRTAFMTRTQRSGVSFDSIHQLGKSHERQRKLAAGKAGFPVDFPLYDQSQSQMFEAIVWQTAGDFAESMSDTLSAEQARQLHTTSLNKFVKLVGFTEEQASQLEPQFRLLSDSELKQLAKAAVVSDIVGYVIPVFWGMLSGSPSTTIANTLAGLGFWSVSLARLLASGISYLGLDLNTQSGDDLDTYSTNPVSALAAYRLIASELQMRDSDWTYRHGTTVFLKVLYKTDSLVGFVNRALIPFAQRSPSSALSYSPQSDISELNDLVKLLELRGADIKPLRKYYYRAVDSILTSFRIPTSSSARHIPVAFGGLGVLPLSYSHSIVKSARVRAPEREPLSYPPTDLMDRGARALAEKAGYPSAVAGALKKVRAQAESGVVEYMRDSSYRDAARQVWIGFSPPPEALVLLRFPKPRVLPLDIPMAALAAKEVVLPRPNTRTLPPLAFSVLRAELGVKDALKRLWADGKVSTLIKSMGHYSLQASLGQGESPVTAPYPVSALVSPYLSAWLADAVLKNCRAVSKQCSYDATVAYVALSTSLTLSLPEHRAVLSAYAA